jgi:hypothetical protein
MKVMKMTSLTHAVRELSQQDIIFVSGGDLTDTGTVVGYTLEDSAEVAGNAISTAQAALGVLSNVAGSAYVTFKNLARNTAGLLYF